MNLERIHHILNNKLKCDIFYDERPVWIQGIDDSNDVAKIGFVDNFEEKDVYIEDLYERNLYN
ncbi:MAG: H-type small acid-soluble spore protein [Clostridia bacterium]|nr:H-type small acid-soluble spore protein [Clostridia bacterium]